MAKFTDWWEFWYWFLCPRASCALSCQVAIRALWLCVCSFPRLAAGFVSLLPRGFSVPSPSGLSLRCWVLPPALAGPFVWLRVSPQTGPSSEACNSVLSQFIYLGEVFLVLVFVSREVEMRNITSIFQICTLNLVYFFLRTMIDVYNLHA